MLNKKSLFIFIFLIAAIIAGIFVAFWLAPNNSDSNNSKMTGNQQQTNNQNQQNTNSLEYSEDELVYSGSAPVYITIYSHNEDSWEDLVNTQVKYEDYRQGLVDRAELLGSYGITWNWQTDQPVVEAMIKYENDPELLAKTDGKNILQFLQDNGASLDPHAHTNNYADIAFLMEKLSVKTSGVIGGTVVLDCGKEFLGFLDFQSWHKNIDLQDDGYVHGEDFSTARWKPTVLSDPGMGGHWFDDWSSGVWQPGDAEDFLTHNPVNEIIYIGEGYPHDATIISSEHASSSEVYNTDGQYIKELVKKIADKELPTGTKDGRRFIYTASIHVRDTDIVNDGTVPVNTIEGVTRVMEELKPLKDSGRIIFADFETVAKIWQSEYNSVPWRIDLSSFSFYKETKEQAENFCEQKNSREAGAATDTRIKPRP